MGIRLMSEAVCTTCTFNHWWSSVYTRLPHRRTRAMSHEVDALVYFLISHLYSFFSCESLLTAFALFFPGYSAKLASLLWGLKLPEERLQWKWPIERLRSVRTLNCWITEVGALPWE